MRYETVFVGTTDGDRAVYRDVDVFLQHDHGVAWYHIKKENFMVDYPVCNVKYIQFEGQAAN